MKAGTAQRFLACGIGVTRMRGAELKREKNSKAAIFRFSSKIGIEERMGKLWPATMGFKNFSIEVKPGRF